VDDALRARGAQVHRRVVECHPEVMLAALAGPAGVRLATTKSAAGALQRLRLLGDALGRGLPPEVPPGAALDDALDAAACALAARRWARGRAEVLGGEPDALGVPMRIVVWRRRRRPGRTGLAGATLSARGCCR